LLDFPEPAVSQYLLPILVLTVPVLAIVVLALAFGRRLGGSCGGVGADGRCTRCGKPGDEMPTGVSPTAARESTCP
jgi:hypothetical protein